MTDRPAYLSGRGRGRGRVRDTGQNTAELGSWSNRSSPKKEIPPAVNDHKPPADGVDKFADAAVRHRQAALQHLSSTGDDNDATLSSDEEDELDDDKILSQVLQTFSNTSADIGPSDLGSTEGYLTNSIKSKANVCLICIETIRRTEAIWCCRGCYTMFHISCIQKWVKDGVYQQTLHSDEGPRRDLPWNCPKCRHEYPQLQCPRHYYCFCGKEMDPTPDPWLVPHSCGQVCGRGLTPDCGHKCLLLCHPGPCPPCPKTVRVSCYCGQSAATVRRCGTQAWACSQPCRKPLDCGHHTCQKPCHDGHCPPCPETSVQKCRCGSSAEVRPCADPHWVCQQVCNGPLPCGHHSCEQICHRGPCGECPRSGKRTCPCGKTQFSSPCTEDVPTCVDTCGKTLECGQHECGQRCHYGLCGQCRDMTRKKCRCGRKEKEIQCYKEFTCDIKCTNIKDCSKHVCKKKCCPGDCPSCDQPCTKTLGCRNHKCASRCHQGQCYPCPLTVKRSCNCGSKTISLPCGSEKFTRPPRCNKKCQKPPDCHHAARLPHRCHFGHCPPCGQVCDRGLDGCGHRCPALCHTAVLLRIEEKVQRAGPWEAQPAPRLEQRDLPCPPCKVPVITRCLGNHETFPIACSNLSVSSCHRPCGRLLACSNHTCQLECHSVEGAQDDQSAGSSCQPCEEPCAVPRPEGCSHPCLLGCHPALCPACSQRIRMRCHCQQLVLHVECDQWTHADDTERARLQSCQSECPKLLACSHKCKAICHPAECPNPERCVEKVNVRCKCRRKKRSFLCNEVQAGYGTVDCDDSCTTHKEKQKKEKADKRDAVDEAARKREEDEIEAFKRRLEPKKRRNRKPKTEVEPPSFLQRYGKYVVAPLLIVLLAIFVFCLLNKAT